MKIIEFIKYPSISIHPNNYMESIVGLRFAFLSLLFRYEYGRMRASEYSIPLLKFVKCLFRTATLHDKRNAHSATIDYELFGDNAQNPCESLARTRALEFLFSAAMVHVCTRCASACVCVLRLESISSSWLFLQCNNRWETSVGASEIESALGMGILDRYALTMKNRKWFSFNLFTLFPIIFS